MAPLISIEDECKLESDGLLGPVDISGFRLIHKRLLHRASDKEYRNLPLCRLDSLPFRPECWAQVPARLPSIAALIYLGYSQDRAIDLWRLWAGRRLRSHNDFFIFAIVGSLDANPHLQLVRGACSSPQDWHHAMTAAGFSLDLQVSVLDFERSAQWHQFDSLWHLMIRVMTMRIFALYKILFRSLERQNALAARLGGGADARGGVYYPQDRREGPETTALSRSPQELRVLLLWWELMISSDARETPRCKVKKGDHDSNHYTTMYRLADPFEVMALMGSQEGVPSLTVPAFGLGDPPSFHAEKCYLLYNHFEYVCEQMSYMKRIAPDLPAYILRFDVPNGSLHTLMPTKSLWAPWPSPIWFQLVSLARQSWERGSLEMEETGGIILIAGDKAIRWLYGELQVVEGIPVLRPSLFKFHQGRGMPLIEYQWSVDEGVDWLTEHANKRVLLVREELQPTMPVNWGRRIPNIPRDNGDANYNIH